MFFFLVYRFVTTGQLERFRGSPLVPPLFPFPFHLVPLLLLFPLLLLLIHLLMFPSSTLAPFVYSGLLTFSSHLASLLYFLLRPFLLSPSLLESPPGSRKGGYPDQRHRRQVHALGMLGGRLRDRRLGYTDIPLEDLETMDTQPDVAKQGAGIFLGNNYAWYRVVVPRQRARRRRRRGALMPDKEMSSVLEEPLLGDWHEASPRAAPDSVPELELRAWLAPVSHLDAAEALGVERYIQSVSVNSFLIVLCILYSQCTLHDFRKW